ncbi:MAG: hypothetical protein CVV24_13685 [Ignavibacteriae bacterium HGW-Ignavibacteriae-3]|nr:MAG: hypothetical protein CVV24_13685 [Ignavibacteriae bacterium HGW-Ignavibacteriae-3]
MAPRVKIERVDYLIDHLWQHGYLTLSRKFGKYLPAPPLIGEYEVDAVAKYKRKIALGLTVSDEELNDPKFLSKLDFLANYTSRYPQNKVTLFLGVPYNAQVKASLLISSLDEATQKHIKIITLPESTSK